MGEHSIEPEKKKKKSGAVTIALHILLVVLIIIALCGIAYMVWVYVTSEQAAQKQKETPEPTVVEDPEPELVENPIDFAALQEENPEIYAWIYIPNTDVNLPILRSLSDDNYYMDHDQDGNYSAAGAIFTQSMNGMDFQDPVTVVYGHNMNNGSMFATLHYFEDEQFFADNSTMYIYTPGHIYTYEVVAEYQYDNRHIMNSFDFSNRETVEQYFADVLNPQSLVMQVREGATLTADDKIVQLSTCTGDANRLTNRYLVTGKLISDELTY